MYCSLTSLKVSLVPKEKSAKFQLTIFGFAIAFRLVVGEYNANTQSVGPASAQSFFFSAVWRLGAHSDRIRNQLRFASQWR
jgi:hypothetical protein